MSDRGKTGGARWAAVLLGLCCAWAVPACGGADDHTSGEDEHEELGLEADACEHIVEPAAETLNAAASSSDQLPVLVASHQRYEIVVAGESGFVRFEADEESDFAFFLDRDVSLELTDAAGEVVSPEATATSTTVCSEVARWAVYEHLEPGAYTLEFGASEEPIGLVALESAHEH